MVLKWPYYCPTRLTQGQPFDEALAGLLEGRRWVLVTSAGWPNRGAVDKLSSAAGAAEKIISDVGSNPDVPAVTGIVHDLLDADVVVALGGGSVIDAAKGALALAALGGNMAPFMAHLRDGVPLPEDLAPLPLVAVPTTSGTGSEVTCWGTIWGEDRIKHSVSHPSLFPNDTVLDPALCVSMPDDLTIATALDALSHAMESVWNRRHSEVSDMLAEQAIRLLRAHLNAALSSPADVQQRSRVQTAALLAGLAAGTTQTAAAHSISYPFTAHFGVPHGLACSFTLPEVARYNMVDDPDRLQPISAGLGCAIEEIPEHLEAWLKELGIGAMLAAYVTPDVTDTLKGNLITRARAANNIRDLDEREARRIARAALDHFCPGDDREGAVNL